MSLKIDDTYMFYCGFFCWNAIKWPIKHINFIDVLNKKFKKKILYPQPTTTPNESIYYS